MISRNIFAEGMGILAERFGREISPRLSAIYAETLADLSDDQFVAGVKRAAAELEFFPTAKQIRELGAPETDPALAAGLAFDRILTDSSLRSFAEGRTSLSIRRVAEDLGDVAATALAAIGGARRIDALLEDEAKFARAEFVKAFVAAHRDTRSRTKTEQLLAGRAKARELAAAGKRKPEAIGQVLQRAIPSDTSTIPAE